MPSQPPSQPPYDASAALVIDQTLDYPDYVLATAQSEGEWVKPYWKMLMDVYMSNPDEEYLADFIVRRDWQKLVDLYKREAAAAGRTPAEDMAITQWNEWEERTGGGGEPNTRSR